MRMLGMRQSTGQLLSEARAFDLASVQSAGNTGHRLHLSEATAKSMLKITTLGDDRVRQEDQYLFHTYNHTEERGMKAHTS